MRHARNTHRVNLLYDLELEFFPQTLRAWYEQRASGSLSSICCSTSLSAGSTFCFGQASKLGSKSYVSRLNGRVKIFAAVSMAFDTRKIFKKKNVDRQSSSESHFTRAFTIINVLLREYIAAFNGRTDSAQEGRVRDLVCRL